MDGVRIYFEIQLDEEAILADGYDHSDLAIMHDYMDEAFEANDCHLEKIDDKKRIYTRDVDDKDLLAGTSYHVLEEEKFILCHEKDLGDYEEVVHV